GLDLATGGLSWRLSGAGAIRDLSADSPPLALCQPRPDEWALVRASPAAQERGQPPRQVEETDWRPLPPHGPGAEGLGPVLGLTALPFFLLLAVRIAQRGWRAAWLPALLYLVLLGLFAWGMLRSDAEDWLPGERYDWSGAGLLALLPASLLGLLAIPWTLLLAVIAWWRSRRASAK
ncbi:MAG: hypothetical protein K2W96_18230, partial [Gemmataceae bacterium]|nr:hypothetical protein [Gemmataceae bacterium]